MLVTIKFEDHGQDFLEWDIDTEKQEVVDCRPFQSSVWVGQWCFEKEFEVGQMVTIVVGDHDDTLRSVTIRYPIESIKIQTQ